MTKNLGRYEPTNTLAETLGDVVAERTRLKPELSAVIARFIGELQARHAGSTAPAIGHDLPSFSLTNTAGRKIGLNDYLAKGPIILNFFRGRWCPYCWTTKQAMDDALDFARSVGVGLVGVTPDPPSSFDDPRSDRFIDILHDADCRYASQLNLTVEVDDYVAEAYRSNGVEVSRDPLAERWCLPLPAAFLVNTDGTIADRFIDPDFRNRFPLERFLNRAADLS